MRIILIAQDGFAQIDLIFQPRSLGESIEAGITIVLRHKLIKDCIRATKGYVRQTGAMGAYYGLNTTK
jgi:hypothetical protein